MLGPEEEKMTHTFAARVARPSRSLRSFTSILACVALLIAGCTVRLISDYDEVTVQKTVELQEQCESLFVSLEDAATTADPADDLYAAHAEQYDDIEVSLRMLESRADLVKKNEITKEQVKLLRDSIAKIRDAHRARSSETPPKGLSAATVTVLREPLAQQFRSILALQEGLKTRSGK
jgi:predicted N-formylglutamate amidohydrolase